MSRHDPNRIYPNGRPHDMQYYTFPTSFAEKGTEPALVTFQDSYQQKAALSHQDAKRDILADDFARYVSHQLPELVQGKNYRGNPIPGSKITNQKAYKDFERYRKKRPAQIILESRLSVDLPVHTRPDPFKPYPIRVWDRQYVF